jgi:hypothetical protein
LWSNWHRHSLTQKLSLVKVIISLMSLMPKEITLSSTYWDSILKLLPNHGWSSFDNYCITFLCHFQNQFISMLLSNWDLLQVKQLWNLSNFTSLLLCLSKEVPNIYEIIQCRKLYHACFKTNPVKKFGIPFSIS